MIDKTKTIKVVNKHRGTVGYRVPELGVKRKFYPKESKNITFDELEKLSYLPGGDVLLKDFLEITDEDVILELFNQKSEPEYHYSEQDVKNLLISGTLDQFLDCLDFAPEVIKDMIKSMAVDLPLNDMAKRQAILDKMGFDVTKAIEIKNTKYDGETEKVEEVKSRVTRRTTPMTSTNSATAPSGRRYKPVVKE